MNFFAKNEKTLEELFVDLLKRINQKKQELADLQHQYEALQVLCPHPADRRVVVSDVSNHRDYVSCNDCGKILGN
jgi:predicted  nucleic acid-binding Zn-ribbon protein